MFHGGVWAYVNVRVMAADSIGKPHKPWIVTEAVLLNTLHSRKSMMHAFCVSGMECRAAISRNRKKCRR